MNSLLEQQLELLSFTVSEPVPSLLFTNRRYDKTSITFGARLILEEAKRLSATAVYLRYTDVGQAPIPQVFIYDNTDDSLNDTRLAKIHRQIWSSDVVSVYYVFDKTQTRIFDSRKPVQHKNNKIFVEPFETLALVAEAQEEYQKFSAKLFENGTFWEHPEHRNRFLYNDSSSQKLIKELRRFRDRFVKQNKANPELIHKIIVQSILVKYLEERRDEDGRSVFKENFFAQFGEARDFCDAIRRGQFVNLLSVLSTHFNGKIFELNPADSAAVHDVNLTSLADFLDAKLDDNQYSFWRLYAFDYVPVELISRIYEEFIPQRPDAVYTPIHLAQFMVDECMPMEHPQEKFRIIDVSCGSGIFLVTAFKRMVQWWQKTQYEKTGELQRPNVKILQSILRESIYGVDIEGDAVRLAVFSLSIALCDMLSPTEIWLNLKFDNLEEKNLRTDDFFCFLTSENWKKFDLVIGNPPFKSSSKEVQRVLVDYELKISATIPRDQIALLFLQQAMNLLKKSGLLCFVMPSGPLLYNNTIEYRRDFFSRYEIPQVVDFSNLSRKGDLFQSAISTAVIFARKDKPNPEHETLHVAVKRTKAAKEKHLFEIDHYDLYYVPLSIAISDPIIWKANFLGGGFLYYLLKRMQGIQTFGMYLESQKQKNGWVFGEGFKGETGDKYAPHIYGKPMVRTDQFTEDGILTIDIAEGKKYGRPREGIKEIFQPPHLLIKRLIGKKKFSIEFVDSYLVFRNEIIGIHAPKGYEEELKNIERYFQSNYSLLKLLLIASSGRAGISRSTSTLLTKDFMALPFPEHTSCLELTLTEKFVIDDVIKYGIEELKKGEKATTYTAFVSDKQLDEYGKTFCEYLNAVYQSNNNVFYSLAPIETNSYTCYPFAYGKKDKITIDSPDREDNLGSLIENERDSVVFRRILYLYQNDIIYIVKPKTLKYWLKSIALRDVTQVMQDLIASGH